MGSRVTDYQREQELVRSLAAFGAGGTDCSPDEEMALPERRERDGEQEGKREGEGGMRDRERLLAADDTLKRTGMIATLGQEDPEAIPTSE